MKQYLLATAAILLLGTSPAQAADNDGGIFSGIFNNSRDRQHNYNWDYWRQNRDNDAERGNYHEGHNGKPGHWDSGLHKGQNKKWDNDHHESRSGHGNDKHGNNNGKRR